MQNTIAIAMALGPAIMHMCEHISFTIVRIRIDSSYNNESEDHLLAIHDRPQYQVGSSIRSEKAKNEELSCLTESSPACMVGG